MTAFGPADSCRGGSYEHVKHLGTGSGILVLPAGLFLNMDDEPMEFIWRQPIASWLDQNRAVQQNAGKESGKLRAHSAGVVGLRGLDCGEWDVAFDHFE